MISTSAEVMKILLASFPALLHLQFFNSYSMQKWREKAWGTLLRDLQTIVICCHTSSQLPSDVYETDLALQKCNKRLQRAKPSI